MNREKIILKESYRGKKSTTFTGRPQGKLVRQELKLELKDKSETLFEVVLPLNTTSITASFFLGLFMDSINYLGSVESFNNKYEINYNTTNPIVLSNLKKDIEDCLKEANLELLGVTGLDSIL